MASLTTMTQTLPLASIQPITGWEEFLQHGDDYLKTVSSAYFNRKKAFTPEILYNIVAMSIEKFIMAALMRHGALPYNHTMSDLVESMEETFPKKLGDLKEKLLALDQYQEICDTDTFTIRPPSMNNISEMIETAKNIRLLIANYI